MPSIGALDVLVALAAIAALFYLRKYLTGQAQPYLPYPPGPRGLPLVGNIFDMPKDITPQEAYFNFGRKYGTPASSCPFSYTVVNGTLHLSSRK